MTAAESSIGFIFIKFNMTQLVLFRTKAPHSFRVKEAD